MRKGERERDRNGEGGGGEAGQQLSGAAAAVFSPCSKRSLPPTPPLLSLSLSPPPLSLSLSLYLSIYLSLYLSLYLFLSFSLPHSQPLTLPHSLPRSGSLPSPGRNPLDPQLRKLLYPLFLSLSLTLLYNRSPSRSRPLSRLLHPAGAEPP